jgi:dolichyl-diphosphooligosaccharide--protein glycosyltransferase
LLALAVRALPSPQVFVGEGHVVLALGDAYYHARRALVAFEDFPSLLAFDPYLNYPAGSSVPFPPLYDLVLAGVARAAGASDQYEFERVIAWVPAACGALAILPVYLAARVVAGPGAALGAAAIAAVLPVSSSYSEVGNVDHHAWVSFLGALFLWLLVAAARSGRPAREASAVFAALAVVRSAILLSWGGSLLYLGLGDVLLAATLVARGEPRALAAAALSLLASALAVAPVVSALPTPVGGAFSGVALSWLHVLFLTAGACVTAGGWAASRGPHDRGPAVRLLAAGAAGAAIGAALLLLPALREPLALAGEWMRKGNQWGAANAEQMPLFGSPIFRPESMFGYFAYAIPLLPIGALLRARDPALRGPALLLAGWTVALGVLTLRQIRYGNDFAPAAAVGFALLIAVAVAPIGRRSRWAAAAGGCAVGLMLAAPTLMGCRASAERGLQLWRSRAPGVDLALATGSGTLVRFAEILRQATPETLGFADASAGPAYGVIVHPNVGHVVHYVARRATPADNFGPYVGAEAFEAVERFFALESEPEAVALALRLGSPYVMPLDWGKVAPRSVAARLHQHDGRETADAPRLEHFRLVAEGPREGVPLAALFGVQARGGALYKLFEIVEGAVLEAHGPPGSPMRAELRLVSNTGRRFRYTAATVIDTQGVGRLRVPYATLGSSPVRAASPYRVEVAGEARAVAVAEDDVKSGAVLPVGDSAP